MTTTGFVGLGIIGGALSTSLLAAGHQVVGFDVDERRVAEHVGRGGASAAGISEVGERCDVVFIAVASTGLLPAIASDLAACRRPELVVVDIGTLPLAEKLRAHATLADVGTVLLDCTISGTGAQARAKDLVFMASGDTGTIARLRPLLLDMGRVVYDVGPFGNGIRMKLIANHLVAVHNVAAAEALLLAERAGLDLAQVLEVVGSGAGTSRMFEVRGPMIAERSYSEPTAKVSMFLKDITLIAELAADVGAPTPLFDVAARLYEATMAAGLGDHDAAAVHAVLEELDTATACRGDDP